MRCKAILVTSQYLINIKRCFWGDNDGELHWRGRSYSSMRSVEKASTFKFSIFCLGKKNSLWPSVLSFLCWNLQAVHKCVYRGTELVTWYLYSYGHKTHCHRANNAWNQFTQITIPWSYCLVDPGKTHLYGSPVYT